VNGTADTTLMVVTTKGGVAANQQPRRPGGPPWPALEEASRWLVWEFCSRPSAAARAGCAQPVSAGRWCWRYYWQVWQVPESAAAHGYAEQQHGHAAGCAHAQITAAAAVNTVTVSHNAYLTVNVTP